jgi:transposase-like protein
MPRSVGDVRFARLLAGRRWNEGDARRVLKLLDASGNSVGEFAARHGLDAQRLFRWRAQLAGAGSANGPVFVEIKPTSGAAVEVALRSGHVVRVPDGFAEETLRRVVAVLDGLVAPC